LPQIKNGIYKTVEVEKVILEKRDSQMSLVANQGNIFDGLSASKVDRGKADLFKPVHPSMVQQN